MFEDLKKHFMEGDPFATWWPFLVAGLVFLVTTIKLVTSIEVNYSIKFKFKTIA